MIRSSTTSCAMPCASAWDNLGSKSSTLELMDTFGIGGSTHTREEPEVGTELPLSDGSAAPAVLATHCAGSGPEPTVSTTTGSDPSDSSAAGVGLWVESAEASGTHPTQTRVANAI